MLDDNIAIIENYYDVKTNLLPNNAIKKVEIVQNSVYSQSIENSASGEIDPEDITEVASENIALLEGQGFSSVEINTPITSKLNDYPYPERTFNNVVLMKNKSSILANCKVGEYTFVDMLEVNEKTYVLYSIKSYPFMDFRCIENDVITELPLPSEGDLPASKGVVCAISESGGIIYLAIATESNPYLHLYKYQNSVLEKIDCSWNSGLYGKVIDMKMRGTQGIACLESTNVDRNFIVFDIAGNSFEYKNSNISGYYPLCVNFLPQDNSYGVMGGVNYPDRCRNGVQYQTDEPYRFYSNGVYRNMFSTSYNDGEYTSFDTAKVEFDGRTYYILVALMSNCLRVFDMGASGLADYSYTLSFAGMEFGEAEITKGFDKIKLISLSTQKENYTEFQSSASFDVIVSGKGYQSAYQQYYKTTLRFSFEVAYVEEPFSDEIFSLACRQYKGWEHMYKYTNSIASAGNYLAYINSACSATGEDVFLSWFVSSKPVRLDIDKEQTASMRYVLPNTYGDVTPENYQLNFKNFTWGRQMYNTRYGNIVETKAVSSFSEAEGKGVDFNKNYIEASILLTQSEITVILPNVLLYSYGNVLTEGYGATGFDQTAYYSGLQSFEFEVMYGGLAMTEVKTTLGDEKNKLQVYQISSNDFYESQSKYGTENLAEHNANTILSKWNKGRQYLEIEVPVGTYKNEKGEALIGENMPKQEFVPYDRIIVKTRKGYPFIKSNGETKVFEIVQMTFRKKGYKSMTLRCLEV